MPVEQLHFEDADLAFEEEIIRNPYSVKSWFRYVDHSSSGPVKKTNIIYERSLKELPGSYKLWYAYLRTRREQLKGVCINSPAYEDVNNAHERALVFMHKMPRIWIDYCKFLVAQNKITRTRRTFDRALRALPITQHKRLWPLYIDFVKRYPCHETAVRVFRRMLKLHPENAEQYIDYLISIERIDEACLRLADIVNDQKFTSQKGKTNYALWHELCKLMSDNPERVNSLNVEAIIRGGLKRFTDQLGQLWCSLADYYIKNGLFERARDIYEEAIETVKTKRDFTQVFDAYTKFEEGILMSLYDDVDSGKGKCDKIDIDLRLARYEDLLERRLLLLNSVLLRQNPHNVLEWLKRVELFKDQPHQIISTFTAAIQTIEIPEAVGKIHKLWIEFANFYVENGQINDARDIFRKAVLVHYKSPDDLASVWCAFAEMEIENDNEKRALSIMKQATAMPARRAGYFENNEVVQNRVYRSLKLWSLYADLEEAFGTNESCKSVYDRMIDLKIATPQIIINYGKFLEENNFYEDSFKAYERAVTMFKWPNVFDIWNKYLDKFIKRYGGKKLERARDLFEQALEGCPAKFAKNFYLMYAKLEEDYGLTRHAMAVYARAVQGVRAEEKHEIFNIYIGRVAQSFGVTHTRTIYEKAISELTDEHARDFCVRFADMETKLGEIDRARAIYAHGSQMCDPRSTKGFWTTWKTFESKHGNEDTVKELLRIQRSVQATYNTQVNFMSAQMLAAAGNLTGTTSDLAPGLDSNDGMQLLEQKATQQAARAQQDKIQPKTSVLFVRSDKTHLEVNPSQNPAEIDLDDSDDDEDMEDDEDEDTVVIEKQTIPDEVFGGYSKVAQE